MFNCTSPFLKQDPFTRAKITKLVWLGEKFKCKRYFARLIPSPIRSIGAYVPLLGRMDKIGSLLAFLFPLQRINTRLLFQRSFALALFSQVDLTKLVRVNNRISSGSGTSLYPSRPVCFVIVIIISIPSSYTYLANSMLYPIGHFRVPRGLCFKTRVGVQPLIWKSFFILIQIKLIFTRKVVHLASF